MQGSVKIFKSPNSVLHDSRGPMPHITRIHFYWPTNGHSIWEPLPLYVTHLCTFHVSSFEQSDGTRHEQRGELKNEGRDNEALVVKGQYSWVGPDGVTYIVTYVADEQGFQPQIEQGPGGGVPPAVVASLLG